MTRSATRTKPQTYFAVGQVVLALCLFTCLAIIPSYFFSFDQGGVSNYGTEPRTTGLFVLGFGVATLCTFLAGRTLPQKTKRRNQLQLGLYVLACLYLLVMLTTFSYKLNETFRELHGYASIALFVGMLVGALWLRFVAVRDSPGRWAFVVFCVSLGAGVLTVLGVLHLLFTVQLVCGMAFGYMLTHGIAALQKP
jgi:hypothetical protein